MRPPMLWLTRSTWGTSAASILDHVEKLPQRHAQFLDGAAVDGLLDAIVEEIDRGATSCDARLPKVAADPVAIGQELGGRTENCHPFNNTTGVVPPVGTTGRASTVISAAAVRCSPD